MNVKGALRISLHASKKRGLHNGAGNYCDKCKGGRAKIGVYFARWNPVTHRWPETQQVMTVDLPCRICKFQQFDDAWLDLYREMKRQDAYAGDYVSVTYGAAQEVVT